MKQIVGSLLRELKDLGYIEYHKHDPFIDFHLMTARQMSGMGNEKDNEIFALLEN